MEGANKGEMERKWGEGLLEEGCRVGGEGVEMVSEQGLDEVQRGWVDGVCTVDAGRCRSQMDFIG